jgi:hypothetical protein
MVAIGNCRLLCFFLLWECSNTVEILRVQGKGNEIARLTSGNYHHPGICQLPQFPSFIVIADDINRHIGNIWRQ